MVPLEKWTKYSTGNVNSLAFGKADENAEDLAKIMKRFHQVNYQPKTKCPWPCVDLWT